MYCQHCGQPIPAYSRFCEQCGRPVVSPPAPGQGSPAPSQNPARGSLGLSPARQRRSPDYSRIVLWIQQRYGTNFTPGMNEDQVRVLLESIIANERARGIPAIALKGFRAFIARQNTGQLLQARR